MVLFKELDVGARFFICGGFELQKVQATPDYNAVLLEFGKSTEVWVTLPDDERTYPDEGAVRTAYPEAASLDWECGLP